MESPILRLAITSLLSLLVLVSSAAIAYRAHGTVGLGASALGLLIGLTLILVGAAFTRRARTAQGNAILAAVYGGVLSSFTILIASMVALKYAWPLALRTATLTAFALYLVHRFASALGAWPASGGRSGFAQERVAGAEASNPESKRVERELPDAGTGREEAEEEPGRPGIPRD